MIINGISRKGKNKIKEGLGTEVVVLMKNHPSNPPAVLVAPKTDANISSKYVRWIKLQHDQDFEIVEN